MTPTKTLLIVWHSRTGTVSALVDAMVLAVQHFIDEQQLDAAVQAKYCDQVQTSDVLQASALIFACPENLGAMSGQMKEFFDVHYYPVLDQVAGKAFGTLIAAGSDGQQAQRQIERIATGWRLKRVVKPLIVITQAQSMAAILAEKKPSDSATQQATELALNVAAHGFLLGE